MVTLKIYYLILYLARLFTLFFPLPCVNAGQCEEELIYRIKERTDAFRVEINV